MYKLFIILMVIIGVVTSGCSGTSGVLPTSKGQDVLTIPLIAPDYPSPPFSFQNTKAMQLLFTTTPEALQKIVPQPLVPNSGNMMFLVIQSLDVGGFKYNEVVLGVPVTFRGKPFNYCAYLLVDRAEAITAGREIWGFPKKIGEITLEEKNGKILARATRFGATLIEAVLEPGSAVDPAKAEEPQAPLVNYKLIPGVKKGALPDVKQLTSTIIENYKVHRAQEGPATISFGGTPFDPLYQIPVKSVLGGRYIISDSTLTFGDVIYDYLKSE